MNIEILLARVNELEKRIAKLEKPSGSAITPRLGPGKKLSAKEFLMTKSASLDTERALVLGYFLELVEGMTSFNVSDLDAIFRSAKVKLPTNMNDVVNKNIARGFLMGAQMKKDSKKAWCLTTTGEQYVENQLS